MTERVTLKQKIPISGWYLDVTAVQQLNHKQFSHARIVLTSVGREGYGRALHQVGFERFTTQEACTELQVSDFFLRPSSSVLLVYHMM